MFKLFYSWEGLDVFKGQVSGFLARLKSFFVARGLDTDFSEGVSKKCVSSVSGFVAGPKLCETAKSGIFGW